KPHKVHLDEQIERIADEAMGDRVSVIVQMESREDLSGYLEATSEAIGQRRSVATARALLPPPQESLKTTRGKITPASEEKLKQSASNIARTFLSSSELKAMGEQVLRAMGMKSLEPLLQSDWVREAIARAAEAAIGDHPRAREPVHFA